MSVPRMRPLAVIGLCVFAAAVMSALGTSVLKPSASDRIAASVGDVEYSVADLDDYLAAVDPENEATITRAYAAQWLTEWARFTALELEMAEEHGVRVTGAHRARAVAELTADDRDFDPDAPGSDVVVSRLALIIAINEWIEREVPDIEIPPPRLLCSQHILVSSESEADSVLSRLESGEDFGDLAAELSDDPGSGPTGGDLGCVPEGSFVEPFETAAYAAGTGGTATAVSEFGFHVIRVVSAGPPTAEAHPQLEPDALAQFASEAEDMASARARWQVDNERNALVSELQASAFRRYADSVVVNERYGDWHAEIFEVVVLAPDRADDG